MSVELFTILLAVLVLLGLAVTIGAGLGLANRTFHVPVDVRIEEVTAALPGANCGGCGYVGCGDYAEAVVKKAEAVTLCPVGGAAVSAALARIMGVEVRETWPMRPVVHCAAKLKNRKLRAPYRGERTCHAANLVSDIQGCIYGCLGLGDCTRVCKDDAIHVEDGLARVDYERCTGCGACIKECPRNIISRIPFKATRVLAVLCSNKDFGKEVSAVCEVGCIGCKACFRANPELVTMKDNLPVLNYDNYHPEQPPEAIVASCPRASLVWIGEPSSKDLDETKGDALPVIAAADFKTTVDDMAWRG